MGKADILFRHEGRTQLPFASSSTKFRNSTIASALSLPARLKMSLYSESMLPLTQGSPVPSSPSISGSAETAVESIAQSVSTSCQVSPQCTRTFRRNDKQDPANKLDEPCHGWPQLVDLMVKSPGFESFQTFRDLNIKSLLYYQAELVSLRKRLHAIEWKDHRAGNFDNSGELCANVEFLLQSEFSEHPRGPNQMKLVKKMRRVLKEYSKIPDHLWSDAC